MKQYLTFFAVILLIGLSGILSPIYSQWLKYKIDAHISKPVLIYAADIDLDGDLDLAAAGEGDDDVIWYENTGGKPISWSEHIIDGNLDAAIGVFVADIDGDDDPDVAATGFAADDVVWYENTGGRPISWSKHTIDGNLDGAGSVWVVDINNDGDWDVVAAGQKANAVNWYENDGETPITWSKHIIDDNLKGATEFVVADLDNDGDHDVIITGLKENSVVWYENLGETPVNWNKYIIDDDLPGAFCVDVGDIDGDDTLDVVATGSVTDEVVWYENNHPIWTKHLIDDNLDGARVLYISDIDGNDTLDIVATGYDADEIVWYKNDYPNWTEHLIDGDLDGPNDVITADLDEDGKQDVIVTGFDANKIVWYNNKPSVAHPLLMEIDPGFIPPEGEMLVINVLLHNPDSHSATVHAFIGSELTAFKDSIQLYDDGLHSDNLASDNIWGNSKWMSGLPEDIYTIEVHSKDIIEDYAYYLPAARCFTTIGPLKFEGFSPPNIMDSTFKSGDLVSFKVYVKNHSSDKDAKSVSVTLKSNSEFITIKQTFATIGTVRAQATKQTFNNLEIEISGEFPQDTLLYLPLIINPFWQDSVPINIITGLPDENKHLPLSYILSQNYPNPFNPKTIINYQIPITNDVELSIYSLLGEKVAKLVNERQSAGYHQVEWDASGFSSGVYFYRIEAGEFQDVNKMILLR